MKNIMLAFHNHHDGLKSFPAGAQFPKMSPNFGLAPVTSTNIPGSTSEEISEQAPFGFFVRMLPYIEQKALYDVIDLDKVAFDTSSNLGVTTSNYDAAGTIVPVMRCPNYSGPALVDLSLEPNYDKNANGQNSVAIANYVALGATTIDKLWGGNETADGTIYSGKKSKFRDMADGTSSTAVLAETREETYAAWFDGTTAVVVATHPNQLAKDGSSPVTTLNRGGSGADAYLQNTSATSGATFGGTADWQFGPSSEHPGLVQHAFGDSAIQAVSNDIDVAVYQALVTRRGNDLAVGASFFTDDF